MDAEVTTASIDESEYRRLALWWRSQPFNKGWFKAGNYEIVRRHFLGENPAEIAENMGNQYTYNRVYRCLRSPPGKALFGMLQDLAFRKAIDIAAENHSNAKDGVKLLGRIVRNEVTSVNEDGEIVTEFLTDMDKKGFKPKLRAEQAKFSIEAAGYGPKHININIKGGALKPEEIAEMGKRGENALEGEFEVLDDKLPDPSEDEIKKITAQHTEETP